VFCGQTRRARRPLALRSEQAVRIMVAMVAAAVLGFIAALLAVLYGLAQWEPGQLIDL